MHKMLGYVLLACLLLAIGLWSMGPYDNDPRDPATRAQEQLTRDRLGCMARVGIRRDPPEVYTASKAVHLPEFMLCMASLGYKGEDLVP